MLGLLVVRQHCGKMLHKILKLRFVPGWLFQPSLMFVSVVRAHPIEAFFKCATLG